MYPPRIDPIPDLIELAPRPFRYPSAEFVSELFMVDAVSQDMLPGKLCLTARRTGHRSYSVAWRYAHGLKPPMVRGKIIGAGMFSVRPFYRIATIVCDTLNPMPFAAGVDSVVCGWQQSTIRDNGVACRRVLYLPLRGDEDGFSPPPAGVPFIQIHTDPTPAESMELARRELKLIRKNARAYWEGSVRGYVRWSGDYVDRDEWQRRNAIEVERRRVLSRA